MEAVAFCPAHITGFFKACLDDSHGDAAKDQGSMGAGFSIRHGVTTRVRVGSRGSQATNFRITTSGYRPDKTDVSEFVLKEFLQRGEFSDRFFDIEHEISVPVGLR